MTQIVTSPLKKLLTVFCFQHKIGIKIAITVTATTYYYY
jgi:hypothetical protein